MREVFPAQIFPATRRFKSEDITTIEQLKKEIAKWADNLIKLLSDARDKDTERITTIIEGEVDHGNLGGLSDITDHPWALVAANNLSDVVSAGLSRRNLGLEIDVDVQAYDADLDDIAGLSSADSNFIVGSAGGWVAESGATARTSIGLGTGNTPQFEGLLVSGDSESETESAVTLEDEGGFKGRVQMQAPGTFEFKNFTQDGDIAFKFLDVAVEKTVFFDASENLFNLGDTDLTTSDLGTFGSLIVDTDTLVVDAVNDRVGIGTAEPTSALDVFGAISIGGAGYSPRIRFEYTAEGEALLATVAHKGWVLQSVHAQAPPMIFRLGDGTTISERMRILQNGNIGLSEPDPTGHLHLTGNLSTALTGTITTDGTVDIVGAGTNFDNGEISVGDAIKIESDVGAGFEIFTVAAITDDTHLELDSAYAGSNDSGLWAKSDPDLFVIDNGDGTNLLTVDKRGNVGIKQIPTNALSLPLDKWIDFGDNAVKVGSDDDGYLDLVADVGIRMSGDVTIGHGIFTSINVGAGVLVANITGQLAEVGINTATPSCALDVVGSVAISDDLTVADNATISGFLALDGQVTMTVNDRTPDVSGANFFLVPVATTFDAADREITDFDGATTGQIIFLVGQSDAASEKFMTIQSDEPNFRLQETPGTWTAEKWSVIGFYVVADNDYLEIFRTNPIGS